MNKKISLYNVQIQPQKIILEFVYKFEQNNQNINIYLAEKDNKYSAQIYKNEETKEAKVVFVLSTKVFMYDVFWKAYPPILVILSDMIILVKLLQL